ncbi:hypothetical protein RFI_28715 [Reticulomyxa filosa]|uniref:Uncharacterized protein n=1 Tax=Reticulomyxa filosa TaxID=46433 RepID=X6M3W7_RETFI|nr:hypothetical protein RFI_28715 [Reticulomyxa filosa]|eukprot:ETO08673.1 hypothetical protein RFI_28715 [Reticulomyxa filosa]
MIKMEIVLLWPPKQTKYMEKQPSRAILLLILFQMRKKKKKKKLKQRTVEKEMLGIEEADKGPSLQTNTEMTKTHKHKKKEKRKSKNKKHSTNDYPLIPEINDSSTTASHVTDHSIVMIG